jgi:tetrapyrrole methylase family protein/MazG family protein
MYENLLKLIETVKTLRSPNGCEWDKAQTHKSLKQNFIEETYEALEAIDENNMAHLREELGDVLLQVLLHAQIADDEKAFCIDDVAKELNEKLIRRHPHVFGNTKVKNTDEILANWEEIKKKEKQDRKSVMDGIPIYLPALMQAYKISKKAVKVGFEWDCVESLKECINSEMKEFEQAVQNNDTKNMEEEMGDLLFAIVNLSRWYKINPELALNLANKKFMKRFRKMEELAQKDLTEYSFEEYDKLWKLAKMNLKEGN